MSNQTNSEEAPSLEQLLGSLGSPPPRDTRHGGSELADDLDDERVGPELTTISPSTSGRPINLSGDLSHSEDVSLEDGNELHIFMKWNENEVSLTWHADSSLPAKLWICFRDPDMTDDDPRGLLGWFEVGDIRAQPQEWTIEASDLGYLPTRKPLRIQTHAERR